MQQVPADQVIAILTTELADMYREQAILKVQLSMLNAQLAALSTAPQESGQHAEVSSLSSLPAFPETTPAPDLATA